MKLVASKVRPFVVVGLVLNVITNESLGIAKESNKLNGHLQTSIATNFSMKFSVIETHNFISKFVIGWQVAVSNEIAKFVANFGDFKRASSVSQTVSVRPQDNLRLRMRSFSTYATH